MYQGHRDQRWGHISYAQHADDFMILNICELIGLEKASWLDIGAHHPLNISNTALLYERGWRGVNVEANPNLIEAFDLTRPEDINVNVGVGLEEGTMPFYMRDHWSGLNTFKKEAVNFEVMETKPIAVTTINEIVRTFCKGIWPNILLTDIEGMDYEILESAQFGDIGPDLICTEVRRHETAKFMGLLMEKGYFFYVRMGENLFFVHNRHALRQW